MRTGVSLLARVLDFEDGGVGSKLFGTEHSGQISYAGQPDCFHVAQINCPVELRVPSIHSLRRTSGLRPGDGEASQFGNPQAGISIST